MSVNYIPGHVALEVYLYIVDACGTGGAGLVGSVIYLLATSVLGLSAKSCLLSFSILPTAMILCFFFLLNPHYKTPMHVRYSDDKMVSDDTTVDMMSTKEVAMKSPDELTFKERLQFAKELVVPYMLPLFAVYFA
jgi:battenin